MYYIARKIYNYFSKTRELTRTEFFFEFFPPVFSIISLIVLIDSTMTVNLNLADFKNNAGIVTEIRDVFYLEKNRNASTKEEHLLVIGLKKQDEGFKLSGKNGDLYLNLLKQIIVGDSVNIYTRQDFFSHITLNTSNEIYQIEKNGKVMFSLESIKVHSKSLLIASSIGLSISLLITVVYFWLFR